MSAPQTTIIDTDVAILGGGPAGLAAAEALAGSGIAAVILDEGARLGGQIYRRPPRDFAVATPRSSRFVAPSHAQGHDLLEAVEGSSIEVRSGATVFDLAPGRVWAECSGQILDVRAKRLLLAAGAMDRSLPFPGWTLPGVITLGAAQVMVRGQGLRPGRRAVVAGTGPLLLPTVTALLSAGTEVVALLEANRIGGVLSALPAVLRSRHRRREALHYLRRLLGAGVRMRYGRGVVAAIGDGERDGEGVQRVVMARLDARGVPIAGSEEEIEADVLCVGYGLTPSIDLALRLDCELRHRSVRGGWLPRHDENMQTSVPGVYVAGETAGIGGADVAVAEGRLAGRSIAASLGAENVDDLSKLRRIRRRERRAVDAMLAAFPVLPGLYGLARAETIVCRCEDVTFASVERASRLFGADIRSVKLLTRAGMGPCQARVCHRLIGGLLKTRLGSDDRPTPPPSVQLPLRPVSIRGLTERSS